MLIWLACSPSAHLTAHLCVTLNCSCRSIFTVNWSDVSQKWLELFASCALGTIWVVQMHLDWSSYFLHLVLLHQCMIKWQNSTLILNWEHRMNARPQGLLDQTITPSLSWVQALVWCVWSNAMVVTSPCASRHTDLQICIGLEAQLWVRIWCRQRPWLFWSSVNLYGSVSCLTSILLISSPGSCLSCR